MRSAIPYCGAAPVPADWLARWNLDPVLLAALALAAVLGWRRAADRAAFALAMAVLALLLVSPLCALTSALLSARVAHHVVLVGVAAPLLARAFDLRIAALAPLTALHLALFAAWHVPALYAAALADPAVYWAMQASLLASAVATWGALRRAAAPAAVAALLGAMVAMGLIGALLVFAGAPVYAPHLLTTAAWGLTPLEDQQLAGLVMWVPAAGLYLGAALAIGWRSLAPDPRPAAAA